MKVKIWKCVVPFLAIGVLASCGSKQTALLEAEFDGLSDDTVYIKTYPLAIRDSVAFDTVRMRSGKFSWNPGITTPTEVVMEMGRDRKSVNGRPEAAPMVYSVSFLVQPGEKIRLNAVYEDGFLSYTLKGSAALDVQTRLRNSVRIGYKQAQALLDKAMEAVAQGVENADEKYVDSIYAQYAETRKEIADATLAYVRKNPDELLSGFFLLRYPDRDTFLAYYQVLDSSVRNGILKERLDEAKTAADRMRVIRENDAMLAPGATAPDFTLLDLEGKPVKLSDFSGKYVVLDFWGTWCPWCVKGIPQMKEYYAKHKSKVVFLSIACRDKPEKVKAFVEKESIDWINVMNGSGADDVSVLYGISGFPTKVLLEPGLKVKAKYLGEVPGFYQDLDAIR